MNVNTVLAVDDEPFNLEIIEEIFVRFNRYDNDSPMPSKLNSLKENSQNSKHS